MNNQGPDKKALAVLGIVCLLLLAYVAMGVMQGEAHAAEIMECSDEYMPPAITAPDKAAAVTARLVDEARERAQEAEQAADYDETVYEYQESDYADYSGSGTYYAEYNELYNDNGPSRSMPGWYDGYLETYYSSNTMRHYRTDEWTVDDEGFYRDDQGRYIVGVDIAEGIDIGTEVETGRGTAVVMDYGSGAHVHDFYTNWN